MKGIHSEFRTRLKEVVGENMSEFARKVGIPQPSLHSYLSGKYAPGYDFFLKLAEIGVDINWLLTGQTSQSLAKRDPWISRYAGDIAAVVSGMDKKEKAKMMKLLRSLADSLSR